ncbi:MAG: helix-turn-helix domain-containing protein, partial [Fimbriimonadaceae bacterium]|nr:helix-turn-helix domain-containing protein [Alphaproteobacteria bacterium]
VVLCPLCNYILKIHAIEEIASGQDDIIAYELQSRRLATGVSLEVAAWSTGADALELQAIENGQLRVFADMERLRLVLFAYCDYLDVDPGPMVARLEVYFGKGHFIQPNLHASTSWQAENTGMRKTAHTLVFLSCLILPIYFAWSLVLK